MISVELIGVAGTILIVIAFLQNGEIKIRILDLLGAILFVIYGVVISSFSTVLLNAILCVIQVYKLWRLYKAKGETDDSRSNQSNA